VQAFVAGIIATSFLPVKQGRQFIDGFATNAATPESAAVGHAAQLHSGATPIDLTPRQRECLARGEKFKADLLSAQPRQMHHPFDEPFVSPITTARDPVFFDYASRTPTDKVTAHAYHNLYSRYLPHARLHDLNILEVGLGCNMFYGPGASLNLWRALLPCANISFVEYDAECANKYKSQVEMQGEGRLYIGSQDDPKLLAEIVADAKAAGGFDMIVDDGSHSHKHIWATLNALWPTLKPGGVYVIEDLIYHWFFPTWSNYTIATPATSAVPLFQRLIHTMNCLTTNRFSEDYKAWCRKEQDDSIFKDVINIDCMPDACALVKGRPLAGLRD
jgi:hypothetical protein